MLTTDKSHRIGRFKSCLSVSLQKSHDLMPVMDSPEYAGKNQGELLKVAKEKGVKVSVVSPRKTPEFIRAFEAAGGDMASAKVLLRNIVCHRCNVI